MPLQKILRSSGKDTCRRPAKQTDLNIAGQEKEKTKQNKTKQKQKQKHTHTHKTEKPNVHLEVIMQPEHTPLFGFFFHASLKNEINTDPMNPLKFSNIIVIILYKSSQNENDHE